MKNHFDISDSIEISEVDIAGVACIMVVPCKLKILSLVMPDSYPRDGIFNLHLISIKDTYSPCSLEFVHSQRKMFS